MYAFAQALETLTQVLATFTPVLDTLQRLLRLLRNAGVLAGYGVIAGEDAGVTGIRYSRQAGEHFKIAFCNINDEKSIQTAVPKKTTLGSVGKLTAATARARARDFALGSRLIEPTK